MRAMKTFLVVGLIALVATSAMAATVPSVPNGPTYLQGNNRDQGTGYFVDPSYDEGADGPLPTNPDLWPVFDGSGTQPFYQVPAAGQIGDEDTWGIFNLLRITPGTTTGPNDIDDAGALDDYNWDINRFGVPADPTALVGVFHSGVDESVVVTDTGSGLFETTVKVSGAQFELWAVDMELLESNSPSIGVTYDAGDRTALNRMAGWLDATTLAGATKLLTGESRFFEFTTDAFANFTFEGSTTAYFDIDPNDPDGGVWNSTWGQSDFYTTPDGDTADLFFSWNLLVGTDGWAANSIDDGGVYVVPEPVTMLSLFGGVAGLGAYIRKRRS